MTAQRITKKSVDALTCPPGKDREFLWDNALSGFGVAALGQQWQEEDDRFVAWVEAHPRPKAEWLETVRLIRGLSA